MADSSDEIISLEDLVRDTNASTEPPPIGESVTTIDNVLAVEDPGFAAQLDDLKAQGATAEADFAVDEDVETILARERAEKRAQGWRRLRIWLFVKPWRKLTTLLSVIGPWIRTAVWPLIKAGAIGGFKGLKATLTFVAAKVKAGLGWFAKLPKVSKLLFIMTLVFAGASVVMIQVAWRGSYLPSLQRDFLVSFAPVADQAFTIENDAAWEDLNDPLLHPEHMVLIERLVVNFRPESDDSNPMGMIDLYVEAGSKEAAVELKDREAEMRDMILRTMEQMTYDDLSTDAGKTKLKIFLRKNLNERMVRGRVRRVFYKSMVLKP